MKKIQLQPYPTIKRFCRPGLFAISVAMAAFFSLAQAQAQTITVIENFDGFASSAALNLSVSAPTANAFVTLGASDGVGGSQALNFQGKNGSSPYFSKFTFNITPFSLSGLEAVTVQATFLGGSNEKLHIDLLDSTQTTIATGPVILTQSIPTTSFITYTIPTSSTATITGIRFTYAAQDYGTTTVAFDNIATVAPVPEPATFALVGLGLATLLVRRGRKTQG